MIRDKSISIIGPGKVGTALARLAARAGLKIVAMGGRNRTRTEQAAANVGANVQALEPVQAARLGEVVLLTVNDDSIRMLCDELSRAGAFQAGAIVAHCSGTLTSNELTSARQARCYVASMHPLQTFPNAESACEKIANTYFFIEGDEPAAKVLEEFSSQIGGRSLRIEPNAKTLYHAAAVMACNYLTALIDAALATGELAGIDRNSLTKAIEGLVRSTVDNVFSAGTVKALTGPVVRGDVRTVEKHLLAIESEQGAVELGRIYRVLGSQALEIAQRRKSLTPKQVELMRKLLRAGVE